MDVTGVTAAAAIRPPSQAAAHDVGGTGTAPGHASHTGFSHGHEHEAGVDATADAYRAAAAACCCTPASPGQAPRDVATASTSVGAPGGPVPPTLPTLQQARANPGAVAAIGAAVEASLAQVQARLGALGVAPREGLGPVNLAVDLSGRFDAGYHPGRDTIKLGFMRDGTSYAASSEVVAHELAHRVVTRMVPGIRPGGEMGAVGESLADTLAVVSTPGSDWIVGNDANGVGVRDMATGIARDQAGRARQMPVHMRDYLHTTLDHGGVHMNAAIPNRAAATIGQALGKQALGQIYVDALRLLRHDDSLKISDLGEAVVKAATARFGPDSREARTTREAWTAVGVTA